MTTLTEFTADEESVARAIVRARELFLAAPWLADNDAQIPGCLLLTWADLFAMQKYAEVKFNVGECASAKEG